MFERYTERARRVIFFARYEASQFGSPLIETEHLLLGLLRDDMALRNRFLPAISVESIRKQVESRTTGREKVPYSVDLPLSHECKRVLAHGAEESECMNHKHIGTDHLLLGLLRKEKSLAADILREHGLLLAEVRDEVARSNSDAAKAAPTPLQQYFSTVYRPDCDYVDGEVQERNWGDWAHSSIQMQLLMFLGSRQKQLGIKVVPEQRIQVSSTRFRIPDICVIVGEPDGQIIRKPPFLCIEVVSPEDRMSRIWDRVDDYLTMGVLNVWVVDPQKKAAFQITPSEGWREVKDGILRTANPALDVPLVEIFS